MAKLTGFQEDASDFASNIEMLSRQYFSDGSEIRLLGAGLRAVTEQLTLLAKNVQAERELLRMQCAWIGHWIDEQERKQR